VKIRHCLRIRSVRAFAALLFVLLGAPAFGQNDVKKGDVKKGEDLSVIHCARCHVIGDFNKFGGLGSTPSFPLIAGMEDGYERFETFFERRPHPVFVRVPDVKRWSSAPAYATEFTVTPKAIEDLMAYVKTIKPKDLSRIPTLGGFGPRQRNRLGD